MVQSGNHASLSHGTTDAIVIPKEKIEVLHQRILGNYILIAKSAYLVLNLRLLLIQLRHVRDHIIVVSSVYVSDHLDNQHLLIDG